MNKNQIAKKYSKALINSAEISTIPVVIEELKAFSRLIDANRKLRLLFSGQIFSENEKDKALSAILPSLKFSSRTEKFLRLIVAQGNVAAIREVIAASINAYNERQKKAKAVVISSVPLDKNYSERLKNALKAMTQCEIDIESRVDSSLLGGFIVKVGSTIYDSSLKGQLRLLRAELIKY
ncbi:MAG: ATP synthase F1 subunit delta [Nitrospirae bacterium]|nr:ATP synthase F1 subunit delta [Nitrospirota bacterium]